MKETFLFEYIHHDSLLNRMNPLLKLVLLPVFCVFAGLVSPVLLPVFVVLLVFLLLKSSPATKQQIAGLWKLYIFFAATGAIKFITSESVIEGISFTIRLTLMVIAGLLFYTSTRITALNQSLEKVLSYLPFINGKHLAEIVGMTLIFLPLIFKTMNELQDARNSRNFRARKNPLRTIQISSIPLMINMFIKTDEMADAWYSRCY